MTFVSSQPISIVRTERGLSISGTRITLYDVMDYMTDGYPAEFIGSLFDLSTAQIQAALDYIETNRAEVECEYRQVLAETEALRLHYESQNREIVNQVSKMPAPVGLELAWEKLQIAKARHSL